MSGTDPGQALEDESRLVALAGVEVVPGVADPLFDPYTRLVTRLLGVPVSLVSFVTAHQQIFASAVGLPQPWASRGQTSLELSFCRHVVADDAPLQVDDAPNDDRVRSNAAIDELGVHAYLGVPLRAPAGEPLGSLCAIDTRPRAWTEADLAALRDIGEAASAAIALRVAEHHRRTEAHDASHRLRTPLTGLRLELEDIAGRPTLTDDDRLGVRAARERVEDLALIVDGLVDSARARAQHERDEVDLVRLASSVAERRRLAATGDHVVHVPGRPVVVNTSSGAVRRVLELLVERCLGHDGTVSLHATDAGGAPRIEVLGRVAEPGPSAPDGLPVARDIAAGIGARIAPLPGGAGYEVRLPGARSLRP